MKVAMIYGPQKLGVEDVETPKIKSKNEVLIKIKAAGVCGSDLHYHRQQEKKSTHRRAGGHEFSGEVVEVGDRVSHLKSGDRVGIEPLVGCGNCRFCSSGKYHLCQNLRHLSGGFGEYTKAPANKVFKLPENISYKAASIVDCVAVGVHAVQRCPTELIDTAVILGDAAIGLSTMQVAKANGARHAVIIGHHESSLEIARKVGADFTINSNEEDPVSKIMEITHGKGADVIYESVGGYATTLEEAQELVRPGGTIVVIGIFRKMPELNFGRLLRNETNLLFSWSYSTWDGVPEFQIALDLIAERNVLTEPLITHMFPLEKIDMAFKTALDKYHSNALKVLVRIDD